MPFIDLPTGARLHYEDVYRGDSPQPETLIAIHGWLGTARSHLGRVIDWLSADYRVLGPTRRGYGESLPKPRDYPYDFYHRDARDMLAFMDALRIDRAHLMGFSDGGETALVAAGLAPERFLSVAVWGAVGYFGPAMRPVIQRSYPATWLDEETKRQHGITDGDQFVLGWINAVKTMIDRGGDVSLSLAPKIACPLLLMLGYDDLLNPREYGETFARRAPDGRLVMFPCGHAIHDQRWEDFQRVVGDFLQQVRRKGALAKES